MTTQETITHHWHVFGHDWAVDFLRKGLLNGRTRHAFLITGTRSIGKMTLAQQFAMALNCQHEDIAQRPCFQCKACKSTISGNNPDLIYTQVDETSGALKIDAIRNVTRLLALKPYSSRHRVAIFDDFDMAAPQAQDALLKTLEEPAPHAVMILLAQSTDRILSTITSRSQIVPLRPVPMETIQQILLTHSAEEDRADLIARLSSGRVGWALEALVDEDVLEFRSDMLNMLNDIVSSNRVERMKIADQLSRKMGRDKPLLRYVLEIWQTYWRDVLLECHDSPVKPCNSDRKNDIRTLVMTIDPQQAYTAISATQRTLRSLSTNANVRLVLDVLFLDYPGIS